MARARRGAILPHAPLLVPDIARSRPEPGVERVRAAMLEVARGLDGPAAIVSPHGAATGVYLRSRGDLSGFGVPRASARVDVAEREVHRLAEAWGKPVLDRSPDHGVVVPLLVGDLAPPVVAIALAEDDDAADAAALAAALRSTDLDVVASVNTGAGITSRAPLTELEGTGELERELRAVLGRDAAGLGEVAVRLAGDAGSCCLGPLLVMADLFAGRAAEVLAHEWPYGVGYLVARFGDVA